MADYQQHLEYLTQDVSDAFPGNEVFISQLATLITTYPPTFIHVHDPTTPRTTASVIQTVLSSLSAFDTTSFSPDTVAPQIAFAQVNAVACFTPRLLYDTVLNKLAKWHTRWEDGCANWSGPDDGIRYNDSLDAFMHGLRALRTELLEGGGDATSLRGRKGKAKAKAEVETKEVRMVLVVERAERVLNLSQSQVDITTIFLSDVQWDDIKPSLGAALDPYRMVISPPTKQATLQILTSYFPTASSSSARAHAHHPALAPLYALFISALHSVCAPFTSNPHELAYIAAARWPGFVQPVLDAYAAHLSEDPTAELAPPAEDARMRLLRYFTPSFTAALESLYPRLTHARAWARANEGRVGLDVPANPRKDKGKAREVDEGAGAAARGLPTMSKFVLVAAFLASTNPPKTDIRMFARGRDEKRKRRKGGGTKKTALKSGPAKVPQRLLGPMSFPLDRLLAILAVLLEEYDYDSRVPGPEYTLSGEYTEMELYRVHVTGAITELASMRLLHRTSQPDKIDGPPTFKCAVSYEVALALGRDLRVPVLDLMWEAV
ncbi:hypothetical protein BV25DRAFT_1274302 [Artomyces pyxidatus]|uniref:Uncharacterized protein n=1 Tax=Artomyces pyxidatus TaxID=48021 RepID=A0ACB8TF38_9AGAM|nr:hypothetical protein BV25DRAFT_1274302 [Artomyces pyxidatus]